ncbi:MAG: hypothetical protein MUE60_11630 [Candidatus Eisenbacteria bacterium]|nr:hypothetical protein [Candidatus Eisenbacteria bacterium]
MKPTRSHASLLAFILMASTIPASGRADDLVFIQRAIEAKGAQWTAGPNRIWDRSPEDRRALLGWDRSLETREPGTVHLQGGSDRLPPAWDWRNADGENFVTPIRDQAQCGSCWAFGAVAAMESRMALDAFVPNPTVDLSEQYLVSCSPGSCNGYSISGTCEFLENTGTITEGCMGYEATDNVACGDHCPFADMETVRVQDWGWIGPNRDAIKTAVLNGPVYVAFIVYSDFQAYNGGVYEHVWGGEEGGHAVAIVGWDDALECWICKNSWGDWGEGGYFRIKYGQCMMEDWSIWLSVELPGRPNLSVSPVALVETSGDGDGIANPGEQASLSFWVINSPYWGSADGLTLTLAGSGSPDNVTVTQGVASFPDLILPGDSLFCSGSLTVSLDEAGPVNEIPLALTMVSGEAGTSPYQKAAEITVQPSLAQAGWPVLTTGQFYAGPACFPAGEAMLTAVADRWGDLYVLGSDGAPLPGWPATMGDAVRSAPAIGDLDGDGVPEIVVGSRNNKLAAYRLSGEPLVEADVGAGIVGTVMLADLDGDSRPEMVAGTIDSMLWAVMADGTPAQGWPVDLGAPIISGAALAPLPEGLHVVCGTRAGALHLLDSRGVSAAGWPVTLAGEVWTEPVVADVDADGALEILCAARGSVHLLELDGTVTTVYSGSPYIRSALLSLDMNGDTMLEAVFATSDMKLHVVDSQGAHLPGWPKALQGSSLTGLAAADLDGLGLPELLCSTDGGVVYFLDGNGAVLAPSPIYLSASPLSPPSLADLDADGDLELVVGTDAGVVALDQKDPAARPCWATHRVDLARTGFYTRDTAASPPEPAPHPEVRLLSVSPVPCGDHALLRFESPAGRLVTIELHDVAGRRVMARAFSPQRSTTEETLSLAGVAPGVYRVAIKSGQGVSSSLVLRIP